MHTVTIIPCNGQVLDEFKEHNGISGGVQTLYNFASKVSTYVLLTFSFVFVQDEEVLFGMVLYSIVLG